MEKSEHEAGLTSKCYCYTEQGWCQSGAYLVTFLIMQNTYCSLGINAQYKRMHWTRCLPEPPRWLSGSDVLLYLLHPSTVCTVNTNRPIPRLYLPLVRGIVCVALSLQHKLVRLSNQCRVLQASRLWYVRSLKGPFHSEGYLGWLPHLLLSQRMNFLLRSHLHKSPCTHSKHI